MLNIQTILVRNLDTGTFPLKLQLKKRKKKLKLLGILIKNHDPSFSSNTEASSDICTDARGLSGDKQACYSKAEPTVNLSTTN